MRSLLGPEPEVPCVQCDRRERGLAWASWPLFLAAQLGLLAAGVAAAGVLPAAAVACALGALGMGDTSDTHAPNPNGP